MCNAGLTLNNGRRYVMDEQLNSAVTLLIALLPKYSGLSQLFKEALFNNVYT